MVVDYLPQAGLPLTSAGSWLNPADFPLLWQAAAVNREYAWMPVAADVIIWFSYTAITVLFVWYLSQKRNTEHLRILFLFIAFITFSGLTHLIEALMEVWPAYPLLAALKFLTAVASIATVICLIPLTPKLIRTPTNAELENEIELRKSIEKRLRQSESLFRTSMTRAPIGMALVATDGRWMEINEQLCELFGYSERELKQKTFQEITHPDDLDSDLSKLRQTLVGAIDGYAMEKRYFNKSGKVIYARLHVVLIRDEDNEPQFFVSQIEDISEEKRLLQQQEMFIHELEQKTRELQQIVYVTSHDLRSPLVNIIGFSGELEVAMSDLKKAIDQLPVQHDKIKEIVDHEVPEMLQFIAGSAVRMDRLLKGLLHYSRLGRYPVVIQRIDMHSLLQSLTQDFSFQLKEIGAQIDLQPVPDCFGDITLVSQLFRNLLDNAIKYRAPDRPLRLSICGESAGNLQRYTIADNGVGIAANHQKRIFEVFQRLNPDQVEGDGLGLSICHLVAQRMEGNIRLDSTPGEGSRFHVELPAQEHVLTQRITAMAKTRLKPIKES